MPRNLSRYSGSLNSQQRALYVRSIRLLAVLLGAGEGDDMGGPLLLFHAAVQDRGSAAIGAEARGCHICRHDLAAALGTCEDLHAKYIVLLGVLRLLIFIGVKLCLTIIAHELLRSDVKTQISAAVRAIIHLLTLSAAAVDLCTSVSGQDSRTRCHLPACGCRCKTDAGSPRSAVYYGYISTRQFE